MSSCTMGKRAWDKGINTACRVRVDRVGCLWEKETMQQNEKKQRGARIMQGERENPEGVHDRKKKVRRLPLAILIHRPPRAETPGSPGLGAYNPLSPGFADGAITFRFFFSISARPFLQSRFSNPSARSEPTTNLGSS